MTKKCYNILKYRIKFSGKYRSYIFNFIPIIISHRVGNLKGFKYVFKNKQIVFVYYVIVLYSLKIVKITLAIGKKIHTIKLQ